MIGTLGIIIIFLFLCSGFAIILAIIIGVVVSRRVPESLQTAEGRPRLIRIVQRRVLGGICSGFAYMVGWPDVVDAGDSGLPFSH